MTDEKDELFNFPCDFPIKIMGRCDCELETIVIEIVNKHITEEASDNITSRQSGKGNFISVTVIVKANSRKQLDSIYLELTARDEVLMAL